MGDGDGEGLSILLSCCFCFQVHLADVGECQRPQWLPKMPPVRMLDYLHAATTLRIMGLLGRLLKAG